MTTTRPDLAYTSVKISQANCCPHKHHYHGVKHALKYLYATRDDGIYFWRTTSPPEFKKGPLPRVNSNKQDLLLDTTRPEHDANVMHAYADSDWATCVKTRHSFGGIDLRLARGTIAYKCKFQPTVAGSSTEAEFMATYDTGMMILFMRVFYGTWGSLKRPLPSYTKTTTRVPPWETLKNPHLELDKWISNIFQSVNGLTEI
jgi:hypothetical protein